MTTLVRYDVDDRVASLTLDSPGNRNALSRALVTELSDRLEEAAREPEVRAVVLTHTGRVFCSGADLAEAGSGQPGTDATTAMMAVMTAIVETDKPVIAKIDGHVRAGGAGIVGACDLAVASPAASFAFTEAKLGLAPAIISLTTLDLMPPRGASRYYLTGETFDAGTAAALGLITIATSAEDLDPVTAELLGQIRQTSPQGSAETKKLLTSARRQRLEKDSRP